MWLVVVVIIMFVVLDIFIIFYLGLRRWQKEISVLTGQLYRARKEFKSGKYSQADIEGLPEPVQRYFRAVLKEGQPLISLAEIEHTGMFNMSDYEESWKPFKSNQKVTVDRPGFIWNAKVQLVPWVNVHIYDAYIAGVGYLTAELIGLFNMMTQPHTAQLDEGELVRYLAEAVWYPTALLPGQGVDWLTVDENSARAMLTDGDVTINLIFTFNEDGLVETVHSDGRYKDVLGKMILTPWEAKVWQYEELDDIKVPVFGEVAWAKPHGRKEYFHGRLKRIRYEF